MRIACVLATAVFSLFTYWQLNDYEQYGTQLWWCWVLAYGAVALASAWSVWRYLPTRVYLVGGAAAAIAAAVRVTAIDWSGRILYNETNPAGNETGGLLIVALWLGILAWRAAVASRSRARRTA